MIEFFHIFPYIAAVALGAMILKLALDTNNTVKEGQDS